MPQAPGTHLHPSPSPSPQHRLHANSPGTICLQHFITPAQLKLVGAPPTIHLVVSCRGTYVCCLPIKWDVLPVFYPLAPFSGCLPPPLFMLIRHHRVQSDVDKQHINLRQGWMDAASSQCQMPHFTVILAPRTLSSRTHNLGNQLKKKVGMQQKDNEHGGW